MGVSKKQQNGLRSLVGKKGRMFQIILTYCQGCNSWNHQFGCVVGEILVCKNISCFLTLKTDGSRIFIFPILWVRRRYIFGLDLAIGNFFHGRHTILSMPIFEFGSILCLAFMLAVRWNVLLQI